ncbi:MAG: glycosyltransferase, partial [Bacteroidota bacterium]
NEHRKERFNGLVNLVEAKEFYIDIGCANGGHMQKLFEKGIFGNGIDISIPNIIKGLKDKPHLKFIHGFAEDIPFQDDFFDIAILGDVLEHFRDQEQTLAEILRVVKNGFVICFPNDTTITEEHVNPLNLATFLKLCDHFKLKATFFTHEGEPVDQSINTDFYWIFSRVIKGDETNKILKTYHNKQKHHNNDIQRVIAKDQWSQGVNHERHQTELDRFEITSTAIKGKDILEVGCGNGDLSVFLAKRNYYVTGIDISPEGIKQCKEYAKSQNISELAIFFEMDGTTLNFPDNSFDSIIFSEVFEHVSSSRIFIQEGIRVLKPGGRIYISVPDSLKIHWPGHIRFFTKTSLQDELSQYSDNLLFHQMNYTKWLICTFTPREKPGKIVENLPLVDILLPTYNRPELLKRSIQSIIEQTYENWRLYIINDGGTEVSDIIKQFNDNRIKYNCISHRGKANAVNFALENSSAPFITYMDDDDTIFPNHIEILIKAAVMNNKEFVYTDTLLTQIDQSSNRIIDQQIENTLDVDFEMLQYQNYINHKQIIHTRRLANKVGFYDTSLSILIDWDFIRRMAKVEKPYHIKLITGNHFLYYVNGEIDSISGLWTKNPKLVAASIQKIYSKDDNSLLHLYLQFHEYKQELLKHQQKEKQYFEEISLLKNKNEFLSTDIKNYQSSIKSLSNQNEALATEISKFLEQLNVKNKELEYIKFEYEKFKFSSQGEIETLKLDNLTLARESTNLKNAIIEIKKSSSESIKKLSDENLVVNETIKTLSAQIENQNKLIENNNIFLLTLYKSYSWRITKPLRLSHKKIFKLIYSIFPHGSKQWFFLKIIKRIVINPKLLIQKININSIKELLRLSHHKDFSTIDKMVFEALPTLKDTKSTLPIQFQHAENNTRIFCEKVLLTADYIFLEGWALSESGIAKLEVSLNNEILGLANYGNWRPDVENVFPEITNSQYSGFKFKTDFKESKAINSVCTVKLKLFSNDGHCLETDRNISIERNNQVKLKNALSLFNSNPTFPKIVHIKPIDIIIPIYNGFEYLTPLFNSIISNTKIPYRLIIINDSSTNMMIASYLADLSKKLPDTLIINNPDNLGFVKSVNKAVKHVDNHFVILNTDIEVPPFWLERLVSPIFNNNQIASTTPFTNSGTICSFPNFLEDNNLFENRSIEFLDSCFQLVNTHDGFIEIPTGVGFCMGVNKHLVDKIGFFDDETFQQGYGEENDWCMRAKASGYINIIVPNLFIYHKHGGSFSSKQKKELVEKNYQKLLIKHPTYNDVIQKFIQSDPCKDIRTFLKLLIICKIPNYDKILILDHDAGGGANDYRKKNIQEKRNEGKIIFLVLYDSVQSNYKLTFYYQNHVQNFEFVDFNEFTTLASYIHFTDIVLNELVKFPDTINVINQIISLKEMYHCKITIPLHDYFSICPSYTLLDNKFEFCNVPEDLNVCSYCIKHVMHTSIEYFNIKKWRDQWGRLLSISNIICFSLSSKKIISKSYPFLDADKISMIPHEVDYFTPIKINKTSKDYCIGIPGSINIHKGSRVIISLINIIKKKQLKNLHLIIIGEFFDTEVDIKKYNEVIITGKYQKADLMDLMRKYEIDLVFIPSIVPETFSYTTEETMKMNLPIAVFNIGAPAERVINYPKGILLDKIDPEYTLNCMLNWLINNRE